MSVPVVAFFNNKGGVGKTSLVYHLAWMFSDLGVRVVAADLDPQANLTAAFIDEDALEGFWDEQRETVYGAIKPLVDASGSLGKPHIEPVTDNLAVLLGDLALSEFEADLSYEWNQLTTGQKRPFVFTSVFWHLLRDGAEQHRADLVLMDLGPNLGAINRAALIGADYVVVPLAPDLFSLQGLRNLGPTFDKWRSYWKRGLETRTNDETELPSGRIEPIGYIVLQHPERLSRPTKAYRKWADRIPSEYRLRVFAQGVPTELSIADDPENLASLKHYRSLIPMAQEARKPIFHLRAADGAIGAHAKSVHDAYEDFRRLATSIAERIDITVPPTPGQLTL